MQRNGTAIALALALALPALAIGGQRGLPLIAACLCSMLAGALAFREGAAVPRAAWVAFALAAYCLIQALPLPLAWLGHLSPAAFEAWQRSLHPFGEVPAWGALSLDPGASRVEGAKWAGYGYLLVAATGVRARLGSTWLASLVFVVAVAVALVTLAHGALGARAIYGIYTPHFAVERWSRGPLLNSNNLAGYAILGIFSGIAVWWSPRRALPKWFLGAGLASLLTVIVLSGSRAGLAALVAGSAFFVGWLVYASRADVARQLGLASLGALAALVLVALAADQVVYRSLVSTDFEQKVSVFRDALPMIADYWALGSGRGAFESAFSSYYRPLPGNFALVVSHAENFPLQFLAEWGVLVGSAALVAGGAALFTFARRRRRDPAAVALGVGIGTFLLQNLADLGLEIPAVFAALVVVWAAAVQPSGTLETPRAWWKGASFVLPGALVLVLAAPPAFHTAQDDRVELGGRVALAKKGSGALAPLRRDLEAAVTRHPADPYFPFLVGLLSYRVRDADPLPALSRALERSPYQGPTHLLLAHVLAARGARSQALLHLRLGAHYDRTVAPLATTRAVKWAKTGAELVAALPEDAGVVSGACRQLPPSERSVACWQEYARLEPTDISGLDSLASAWLGLIEQKGQPCAQNRGLCEQAVRDAAAELRKQGPGGSEKAVVLDARLARAVGDTRAAAAQLLKECPASQSALDCHELAVRLARETGSSDLIVTAVGHWLPLACAGRANCSESQSMAGQWLAGAGAWGLALRSFTDAARGAPTISRWLDVARAALETRSFTTAKVALERARALGTATDEERRRTSELEERLLRAE